MKRKILITGIAGCVGHYLFDLLVNNPEYEIYLLIRRPERLKRDISKNPNIHVIKDDLSNIGKYKDVLSQVDYLVHMAVGWGRFKTNYDYTINLFESLDPARCKKVIYFSTASILDENNNVIEEAGKSGTSYIKGKYLCYKKLPELRVYDRITTLFPTWVLGGDQKHPYSHATSGLKKAVKWLWLIRFLSFDVGFHFIHAQDIALIVNYLLKNDYKEKNYVLGNDFIMAENFLARICGYFHKKIYFRIKIKPSFVKSIAALFRIRLSDWDKFCLDKGIFKHRVVCARDFGIESRHATIEEVLEDIMAER